MVNQVSCSFHQIPLPYTQPWESRMHKPLTRALQSQDALAFRPKNIKTITSSDFRDDWTAGQADNASAIRWLNSLPAISSDEEGEGGRRSRCQCLGLRMPRHHLQSNSLPNHGDPPTLHVRWGSITRFLRGFAMKIRTECDLKVIAVFTFSLCGFLFPSEINASTWLCPQRKSAIIAWRPWWLPKTKSSSTRRSCCTRWRGRLWCRLRRSTLRTRWCTCSECATTKKPRRFSSTGPGGS